MAWKLSPNTHPWIVTVVNTVDSLFGGLAFAGGWRPMGPGEYEVEHPSGNAADLGTKSKAQGDQIAAWLVANRGTLGTREVIWYGQIWNPAKGWHPYTGTNRHTDHVHFLGPTADPGGLGGLSGAVPTGLDGATPTGLSLSSLIDIDKWTARLGDLGLTLSGAALGLALVGAGIILAVRPAVRNTIGKAIGGTG